MKNSFFHFAAFFILSLFMANCQKTATPPQEEEEEIIDAVFMALDEDAPPVECGEGGTPIATYYSEEIANGFCRLEVPLIDSAAKSKRGIGAIIRNQAAFNKYFTCRETLPSIDFENYFVLAGLYRHHSGASFKKQALTQCGDTIVFKMEMRKGLQAAPYSIFSMAAIEKKHYNKKILFNMEFTD